MTNRVTVSKLTLGDVPRMLSWGFHDDVRLDHYNFPMLKKSEYVLWYRSKSKILRRKIYKAENEQGLLVGFITIKKIKWFKREAEMGIVFDPTYVGKGYGTEAIALILQEFFEEMNMKRLWLRVAKFNERAYSAYKKVGFIAFKNIEEPYEEQSFSNKINYYHPDMKIVDEVLYSNYEYMEITKEMYADLYVT